MWRQHVQAMKAAGSPSLDFGKSAAVAKPSYVPTTALGWRDHFQDLTQAQLDKGSDVHPLAAHVGNAVGSVLADNPDHQAQIAGAVAGSMSG
jgi:hypothetical protein